MSETNNDRTLVSIIVPVKNSSSTLGTCLQSIKKSDYKDYEIIVVDDHSTDQSCDIAREFGCNLIHLIDGHGANHARNLGAKNAKGEVLVFIDSDIVVNRNSIRIIVDALRDDLDAVVGVYTAKHRNENLLSQYKNLWIRFSYLKSSPAIDWLFGAVSGIKKNIFLEIGGFNVNLLAKHGNDDIELGKRFSRAKANIALNVDLEVEHLKHYSLRTFIKNEFNRSMGFAKLSMDLGETASSLKKGFVNVYPVFVISTIVVIILALLVILSLSGLISHWIALGCFIFYLLINIRFLNYLEQVRGLFSMFAMIPILLVDHLVCSIGSVLGLLKGLFKIK